MREIHRFPRHDSDKKNANRLQYSLCHDSSLDVLGENTRQISLIRRKI